MVLQEIKDQIIDDIIRANMDGRVDIQAIRDCSDENAILDYLMSDNENFVMLRQYGALSTELFRLSFTRQALERHNIYIDTDKKLYGSGTYFIMGRTNASVSNDAKAFAFDTSSVTLWKRATLYAFDSTEFKACNNSTVYANNDKVHGTIHDEAHGDLTKVHGCVECYNESTLKAVLCDFIIMHDNSHLEAYNSKGYIHDCSTAKLCSHSSFKCDGNCDVELSYASYALLQENSRGTFEGDSYGHCLSAEQVDCFDNSSVSIYEGVKMTNCHDDCYVKIHQVGTKLRAYDRSVVHDYSESYSSPLDDAIIIWPNKHRIYHNEHRYTSETPIDNQ